MTASLKDLIGVCLRSDIHHIFRRVSLKCAGGEKVVKHMYSSIKFDCLPFLVQHERTLTLVKYCRVSNFPHARL